MFVLWIYLGIINIVTFIVYGIDKLKAVGHKYRIPERTLLIFVAVGGAAGALLGMLVFRHKIRKPKFFVLVPILLIIEAGIVFWIVRSFGL